MGSARRRLDRALGQVRGGHMLALMVFALAMVLAIWIFKKVLWWI